MKETYNKRWVSVNIPFKESQKMERIFDLTDKLQKKGITFDTGSRGDSMDWELDFSLKGAKPAEVIKFLDENKIEYRTTKVADQAAD